MFLLNKHNFVAMEVVPITCGSGVEMDMRVVRVRSQKTNLFVLTAFFLLFVPLYHSFILLP